MTQTSHLTPGRHPVKIKECRLLPSHNDRTGSDSQTLKSPGPRAPPAFAGVEVPRTLQVPHLATAAHGHSQGAVFPRPALCTGPCPNLSRTPCASALQASAGGRSGVEAQGTLCTPPDTLPAPHHLLPCLWPEGSPRTKAPCLCVSPESPLEQEGGRAGAPWASGHRGSGSCGASLPTCLLPQGTLCPREALLDPEPGLRRESCSFWHIHMLMRRLPHSCLHTHPHTCCHTLPHSDTGSHTHAYTHRHTHTHVTSPTESKTLALERCASLPPWAPRPPDAMGAGRQAAAVGGLAVFGRQFPAV